MYEDKVEMKKRPPWMTAEPTVIESALNRALGRLVAPIQWQPERYADGSRWILPFRGHRGQRLEIEILPGHDIQVSWHSPEKPGSPFEALFATDGVAPEEAGAEVAQFVADLIRERLILIMRKGCFRGGRAFVTPGELKAVKPGTIAWAESWSGRYEHDRASRSG